MFSKISRKRRASALEAHAQGETYLGAPTPAGEGLEPFEGFNDYDVDIDTGDFDRERFNQFQVTTLKKSPFLCNSLTLIQRDTENISVENGSFDSQTDESLHESTRRTFETIENHMQFNGTVKFAELAPTTTYKKADAARRFYEVLLLASKDKIRIKQERSYSDIQISTVTPVY